MPIGGLKLKHNQKVGFEPIIDMINPSDSKLKVLTYSSLKGFMFILNVSPNNSEYLDLNDNFSTFDKPVTSYILKFVVMTELGDDILPLYYGHDKEWHKKETESTQGFLDEAKLQQDIWEQSITGGRQPICPSVANISLFNNDNAKEILKLCLVKVTEDHEIDLLYYLIDLINNNSDYEIGIMTMPTITNSNTLSDFMKNGPDQELIDQAIGYAIYQLIRLYIQIKVMHFDLHSGNVLVASDDDGNIKCFIIDFGRASKIENDTQVKKLYDEFFLLMNGKRGQPTTVEQKIQFIQKICSGLINTDISHMGANYNVSTGHYQKAWLDDRNKDSMLNAFDLMEQNAVVTVDGKLMPDTLRRYEQLGFIMNLKNKTPADIYVNINQSNSSGTSNSSVTPIKDCDPLYDDFCVISGGKNKNTRKRKCKNTRKRKCKTTRKRRCKTTRKLRCKNK
jgi:hypothetical protein